MLRRIRFTVLSSRVSSRIHKCLYWLISPSASYPQPHRQFPAPSGLPILVLWPELGALVTLLCCTLSHAPSLGPYAGLCRGGTEEGITTVNEVCPILLELQLHQRGRLPSLRILDLLDSHGLLLILLSPDCLEAGAQEKGDEGK